MRGSLSWVPSIPSRNSFLMMYCVCKLSRRSVCTLELTGNRKAYCGAQVLPRTLYIPLRAETLQNSGSGRQGIPGSEEFGYELPSHDY